MDPAALPAERSCEFDLAHFAKGANSRCDGRRLQNCLARKKLQLQDRANIQKLGPRLLLQHPVLKDRQNANKTKGKK